MPTRGLRPPSRLTTRFASLICVAGAFVPTFVGIWLGRILLEYKNAVGWEDVFWPETGCSLALVALFGYRRMPWIALGCFLAILCFDNLTTAFVFACLHSLQAGIGLWAIRSVHPNPHLRPNIRSYIVAIGVGGMLVALPASLVDVIAFHGFTLSYSELWQKTLIWWMGEMSSVSVFAMQVLMLFSIEARADRRRPWEYCLYLAVHLAGAWLVFSSDLRSISSVPALFLMFAASIMIALRNGVALSIITNTLFYLTAISAQMTWAVDAHAPSTNEQIIFAHWLMINVIAANLITASGLFDNRRAESELHGVSTRVLDAQEAERRRLSRDLHDSVCQTVQAVVIRMKLLAAEARLNRGDKNKVVEEGECVPASSLGNLTKDLEAALDELRQNITGLRPETIDRSDFTGIVRDHCEEFAGRHHVNVEVIADDSLPVLPIRVREHLFRILQESLANAVTHGGAKNIDVEMLCERNKFLFTVRDDGRGFNPQKQRAGRPRYGLRTMQERAFLMDGVFSIDSHPGHGALITVAIPLEKEVEEEAGMQSPI